MENQTQLKNMVDRLEAINELLKGHNALGKLRFRKLKLEKKRLIVALRGIQKSIVSISALVDLTSVSVLPLSLKKSRYLRNDKGYFNDKNLLCAYYQDRLFVLKVSNSQITANDLKIMKIYLCRTYGENITLVCDNRHNGEIRGTKKQTQTIERIFSRIKKPIYAKISSKQKFVKGQVITNLSYEELETLYVEELRKLRATLINF